MPNVQYQPQQGQLQLSVAEQRSLDWSMLINGRIVDGVLQTRPGWEILYAPDAYGTIPDVNTPDGAAVFPSSYNTAVNERRLPLGSFLFSSADGNEYILSILADLPWNWFEIYTTGGQLVYSNQLVPAQSGEWDAAWAQDPNNEAYCFVRWYDTVFFCNGGYVWKWRPLQAIYKPEVLVGYHNHYNESAGNYVNGPIYGASIVTVHNDSLVLSGFKADSVLNFESSIFIQNSGTQINPDPSKPGAVVITPNAQGIRMTPFDLVFSDPVAPECFQISSVYQTPLLLPVSALASHSGRLAVWSQSEMGFIPGATIASSQISFQLISTGIGCMSKRGHCQTSEGLLVFLGDTNVYAWDGSGAPVIISDQIQALFRQGSQTFWRWNFTNETPDVAEASGLPFRILTNKSDVSCAAWNSTDGYVAIAVTSGTQAESNDLTICWSPSSKQWWIDTCQPSTPTYTLVTRAGRTFWELSSVSAKSAAVGKYTIMQSEFEPNLLFAQTYAYDDFVTSNPNTFICALRGQTDSAFTSSKTTKPTNNVFSFLAVSAPVDLGDSDFKLQRRLNMRTMGISSKDYSSAVSSLKLYVIPEDGHSDVVDSTSTTSVASEQTMATAPEGVVNPATWLNTAAVIANGMYGGTGALPVGWQQSYIKRWYPLAPVDRRLDIPARVTQWFRIGLSKVVSEANSSPVQILSTSVELVPGYGTRRG
jgi:hypothetical protein